MALKSPVDDFAFCKGDRVLMLLNGLEEFGWVRWTGGCNSEELVGVEFDNPIARNNYKNNHSLFDSQPHHGLIVSADSLIHAEDYLNASQNLSSSIGSNKRGIPKNESSNFGNDMSSLSAFHKMAFEQLSGQQKSFTTNFRKEKNWEVPLPTMNMLEESKETLNNLNNRPIKSKPKSCCKATSLLEGGENSAFPSSGDDLSPEKLKKQFGGLFPLDVGKSGGCIIGSSESCDRDSPIDASPLSRNGIDQLEVIDDYCCTDETDRADWSAKEDELGIGSLVEVNFKSHWNNLKPLFGVIRWSGTHSEDDKEGRSVVGIEMEDFEDGLCDGTLKGARYFTCPAKKGLFVSKRLCSKDRRFHESLSSNPMASLSFGSTDCQPVTGSVRPISSFEDIRAMFGRNKGIQGHQNSCYLDATLFSMFAFTSVFDSLLFRPPTQKDIQEYGDVQTVLREEIVNPLRKNMFVRADRIMKLRTMLDHLSNVRGLTTEEKDPEEFLQSLLAQLLRAEPFLQLSSGQEAYHYQLFVDKDDQLSLPSVQTLFDQSFLTSDIKLKQVPSCLIIQMPRFGKDYKMYPRILPSLLLDITDVIENSPRQCIICGKLAEYECRECYGQCGSGLESIAFCPKCMEKVHSHKKRGAHSTNRRLKIPPEFQMLADHCGSIPRVYLELFAVVCIETSHYVAFTRCGSGPESTWCFFDSMADRKGEQHGYNIPTVRECGDVMQWVGEEQSHMLNMVSDDKVLPDLTRRLLCDAYMCFYQSPNVMMYK